MEILTLGVNHQSAPLSLREALHFTPEAMTAFLRDYVRERPGDGIVGLSTCNRTECYVASRTPGEAREKLLEALERACSVDLREQSEHYYTFRDDEAVRHLFRVAAGIDSLVVGEDQILAQVKEAYRIALDAGAANAALNLLFKRALSVAKRARAETAIGQGAVSVASVAVSFIRKIFSDLAHRRALLIGAGETGELVARHLVDSGLGALAVANRTPERAKDLARALGAVTADFHDLEGAVVEADIVLCATSAPEPVLTAATLRRAMSLRGNRLLAAVDISVPRNIDPAADAIAQLFVYDMDALEEVSEENRSLRQTEIRKVEAIVQAQVEGFVDYMASLDTETVIRALRRRIEQIRAREIERYGRKFHQHEVRNLERFSKSLLSKVLHDLTSNLKSLDRQSGDALGEFDALCRALDLDPTKEKDEESGESGVRL
jgi:glutamyl-tRNA reductase